MIRLWLWAAIAVLLLGGIVGVASESGGGATNTSGVHPPKPGTYNYTGTAPFSIRVEADGSGGGVTHQIIAIPTGSGLELRNHVAWTASGARADRSDLQLGPLGSSGPAPSCQWKPATIEYAFPLSVGKRWTMDSTCTASFLGQSATLRRQEEARVTARGRFDLGGTTVDTWTIERAITFSVALPDQRGGEDHSLSTEAFAPTVGLFVRRHIEGGAQAGDLTLVSLKPA